MMAAFIPVRGGSKSIPLKNIKEISGKPLVYWVVAAANACEQIDIIFVSTDSDKIASTVNGFGFSKVRVIPRSEKTATDTASTESAMIEFAEKYEFDDVVLIQATSPLLSANDLEKGIELYFNDGVDSVVSAVRQRRFIWEEIDGLAKPVNYDFNRRPRRQEIQGYLVENGAFYITSRQALITTGCRLSGNIAACEMSEASYYEIDEPEDFLIVEKLLNRQNTTKTNNHDVFRTIRMFLTDCDGVLTDGGMYYSEMGDELKKFNTKDGFGLRQLKENGIITGIITGEDMKLNRRRAEKIGVDEIISGVKDKYQSICELCRKYGVSLDKVAYVGDDLNDLSAIRNVGVGCCTYDASELVKESADYITKKRGGDGAVREIADMIIQSLDQ